jgi:hypothetical protein
MQGSRPPIEACRSSPSWPHGDPQAGFLIDHARLEMEKRGVKLIYRG